MKKLKGWILMLVMAITLSGTTVMADDDLPEPVDISDVNYIFIGDSRAMGIAVADGIKQKGITRIGTGESGVSYVAEGCAGVLGSKDTLKKNLPKYIKPDKFNVIISWFGINGLNGKNARKFYSEVMEPYENTCLFVIRPGRNRKADSKTGKKASIDKYMKEVKKSDFKVPAKVIDFKEGSKLDILTTPNSKGKYKFKNGKTVGVNSYDNLHYGRGHNKIILKEFIKEVNKYLQIENNIKVDEMEKKAAKMIDKTIIIDAGHGGKDSGAVGPDKTYEKNLTLKTALAVEKALIDMDIYPDMTRKGDSYPTLEERWTRANDEKADLFVSIHYNFDENYYRGFSGSGFEVHSDGHKRSDRIADIILNNLSKEFKLKNRGIYHTYDLLVLKNTDCDAILIECGFLSNKNDMMAVNNDKAIEKMGEIIARAIVEGY